MLPLHLLVPILCKAGAWKAWGHTVSTWSVCREWRDAVRGSTPHLAAMLVATHGPARALIKAAAASMPVMGEHCSLLRELLLTVRADCMDHGLALITAACHGREDAVQLLLDWPQHAPHADCFHGGALVGAAASGHAAVVSMLLQQPQHAPRADCQNGQALVAAAEGGHADMVRLLLGCPVHAPRADCQNSRALLAAALGGYYDVVQLLLGWPQHAPHADYQNGQALVAAAGGGHADVVRLLLGWPQHAPRADCQGGRALLLAAGGGHEEVVQLLEGWPQHAPRASAIYDEVVAAMLWIAGLYQGIAKSWTIAGSAMAYITLRMLMWWRHFARHGITRRHDPALARAAAVGYWKLTRHVFRQQRSLRQRLWLAVLVTAAVLNVAAVHLSRFYLAWREAHQQEVAEHASGVEKHLKVFSNVANILIIVCMMVTAACTPMTSF